MMNYSLCTTHDPLYDASVLESLNCNPFLDVNCLYPKGTTGKAISWLERDVELADKFYPAWRFISSWFCLDDSENLSLFKSKIKKMTVNDPSLSDICVMAAWQVAQYCGARELKAVDFLLNLTNAKENLEPQTVKNSKDLVLEFLENAIDDNKTFSSTEIIAYSASQDSDINVRSKSMDIFLKLIELNKGFKFANIAATICTSGLHAHVDCQRYSLARGFPIIPSRDKESDLSILEKCESILSYLADEPATCSVKTNLWFSANNRIANLSERGCKNLSDGNQSVLSTSLCPRFYRGVFYGNPS